MTRKIISTAGLLFLLVLLGCGRTTTQLTIKTDVQKYSPLMSSVFGIGMTPQLQSQQKLPKVEYHWTATNGWFMVLPGNKQKELVNSGGKVTWLPEFQPSSGKTEEITVILKAIDPETGEQLTQTNLNIVRHDIFYTVK